MTYLFLADGFEEIEAVAVIDILRRAGLNLKTVGIGKTDIVGSHGISVKCDITEDETDLNKTEMVILPGGMPGTANLASSKTVKSALEHCAANGKYICAICAAPSVLGKYGLLDNKKFTCYPGCENGIRGEYTGEKVTVDGKIITGIGPGAACEFALEIVRTVFGPDKADELRSSMQC